MSGSSDRDMDEDVARSSAKVNPSSQRGALHTFAVTAVVVLSTLIVIGIGLLIYGFLRHPHPTESSGLKAPRPGSTRVLTLPGHARIQSVHVAGNRLILKLQTDRGQELDILDLRDGHLIARVLAPATTP